MRRAAAAGRRRRLPPLVDLACVGALCLLGAVIVGLHLRADPRLSPIDETQHVDYLDHAAHLELPRLGSLDGPVARHEAACRGIEASYVPPPCNASGSAPDSAFPEESVATASSDPPIYYVTTGLAARLLGAVLGLGSLVTAARLLGAVWLAAGIVLAWAAMGELRVPRPARLAALALIVTTPVTVLSSATVTDDATLLASGAAVLLCTLRWERRRLPGWVLLAAVAAAALTKTTGVVLPGAMTLYLALRALQGHRPDGSAASPDEAAAPAVAAGDDVGGAAGMPATRLLRMAAAVAVTAIGTTVLWLGIVHLRALPNGHVPPHTAIFHVDHLPLDGILGQVTATLSPVHGPPVLAPLSGVRTNLEVSLVDALLIAATVAGTALAARGGRHEALAAAALALMLLSGPSLVVLDYVTQHQYFPIPGRYGVSLLPLLALLVATILRKRAALLAVAGLAAASALYTVVRVATA